MSLEFRIVPLAFASHDRPSVISLGSARATSRDRRSAWLAVGLLLLAFAVTAPWADLPLAVVPAFAPVYNTAITVLDLITGMLLYAQYRQLRERSFLALACGYLFAPLLMVAHTLTFPDAFGPGSLVGGPQSTAWLWGGWHAIFPLYVAAYGILARRDRSGEAAPAAAGKASGALIGTVALALALVLAATVGEPHLPKLIAADNHFYSAPTTRFVLALAWLAHVVALGVLLWATRLRRLIDLWIAVTLVALVIDLALSAILVDGRYEVGFYMGRVYGLFGAVFVLGVLLRENFALYGSAIESAARLSESDERQRFLLALTDELRAITDPTEIQAVAARLVGESLGVNRASYGEVHGDEVVIRGAYVSGVRPMPERFPFAAFGEPLVAACRRGETVVVNDVAGDGRFNAVERKHCRDLQMGAFIAAMLVKDGQWVAVFGVQSERPRPWTQPEIRLIVEVAERTWAAAERARAEAALRESEEKYRTLFETMDEGFALCELVRDASGRAADFRYLEVNHAFEARIGLRRDEVVGRTRNEVMRRSDDSWARIYVPVVTTQQPARLEHYSPAFDRWFDVRAFPRGGDRLAVLFEDITARKKGEEALRHAHEVLEARVIERTGELAATNASLREEMEKRAKAEKAGRQLRRKLVNAQEEERRRISRELHDQLGQQISALTLMIAMLKDTGELPAAAREALGRIEALAQLADGDLDFVVWKLRPTMLDDLGLQEALRDYASDWSGHFGIEARLHLSSPDRGRLDPEVETVLYRVTQEALNNVAKHARARQVDISVDRADSEVRLVVRDDGVGFDAAGQASQRGDRGLGLVSMRERASLLGGQLEIESRPGVGTAVRVRVPVAH